MKTNYHYGIFNRTLVIININIGEGIPEFGSFAEINWSEKEYFIKVEIDESGGDSYTELGISQLLSVPYALHSKISDIALTADYSNLTNKPDFTGWDQNKDDDFDGNYSSLEGAPTSLSDFNNDLQGKRITNLGEALDNTDAVTKEYVDKLKAEISRLNKMIELAGITDNGTFEDTRDGKVYKWVLINDQVWMAENLGWLPIINSSAEFSYNDPRYYVYDYNGNEVSEAKSTSNYSTYGVLYNWHAALSACPEGWHLPTDSEWEALASYISEDNGGYVKTDDDWIDLATHLKAAEGWDEPGNGTDDYGFSAIPGGARYSNMNFENLGRFSGWWTSTEEIDQYPYRRNVNSSNEDFVRFEYARETGLSVRCIKDN